MTTLVLLVPSAAVAATTTVGFDDLAPGTEVTTQYLDAGGPNQGLVLGSLNGTSAGVVPQVEQVPSGQANSGDHVADIYTSGEFSRSELWATFPFLKRFVRVFVSTPLLGSTTVTLTALGSNGAPLSNASATQTKTVTGGAGAMTMLEVHVPLFGGAAIKSIHLENPTAGGGPILKIDDLSFDTPEPGQVLPAPDFGLSWTPVGPGQPVSLSLGGSTITQIKINRSNGSTGDIAFSVAAGSLPSGVSASFSPNPVSGTGSSVAMTLNASEFAETVDNKTMTVIGTPSASAGTASRSVKIPLTVRLSDFDLLVTGIEVTQGIQHHKDVDNYYETISNMGFEYAVQKPGSCGSAVQSLQLRDLIDLSKPLDYSGTEESIGPVELRTGGIHLAEDKPTFARVYANVHTPFNGKVDDVAAVLHGSRGGQALPGSPLSPEGGTRDLTWSIPWVNCRDRADPNGSYVFAIPASWTQGDVDLTAQLLPTEVLFGAGGECGSASCAANNALKLDDVDFTPTSYVTLTPVEMVHGGFGGADVEVHPPSPGVVFDDVITMTPSRLLFGGIASSSNYAGVVSIVDAVSDMKQDLKDADDDEERKEIRSDACSTILGQLEDWADDHPHGDLTIGIYQNVCPGVSEGGYTLLSEGEAFAVAESMAPRGSVAHELNHGFGRPHASKACGGNADGQTGEFWSPDQVGHVHGVGFDPRTRTPLVAQGILGSDPLGSNQPAAYHDFMSYCKKGDKATWISDRGWTDSLLDLAKFGKLLGRTAGGATAAQADHAGERLRVVAVTGGAQARILTVKPAPARALPATASAPYQFVARDASGQVLSSVGVRAVPSHVDGLATRTILRADIPAANVVNVVLAKDGQTLAERARTSNAPAVDIRSPGPGAQIGRSGSVAVRWRATDPDGGGLTAKIDYSTDGGRSFRTISTGSSTGLARLSSALFSASRRARIRVRVSDGFNESQAVSGPLIAVGSPPRVEIRAPRRGHRMTRDGQLNLEGTASDDAGRQLRGRQLRWFAGRRLLGTGERLSASGLPTGQQRIRLVARDAAGRTATAFVLVRVIAAAPQFLRLDAPRQIRRNTKRITLGVAATLPSTLRVGGRLVRVNRTPRRVVVAVPPGRQAASLHLTLSAEGQTRRVRLVIRRR